MNTDNKTQTQNKHPVDGTNKKVLTDEEIRKIKQQDVNKTKAAEDGREIKK
jgi:hypothetical protein